MIVAAYRRRRLKISAALVRAVRSPWWRMTHSHPRVQMSHVTAAVNTAANDTARAARKTCGPLELGRYLQL